ncbi:A/G-specific adenine glycosylase [Candidatus Protochlamydia phocaeensis]|uniref:A/G-specific adenine glycosylase n=1 Tax=Candidatus Protochlamydia phocaeensis TaxID=1414722 RepID=UPI000837AA97|nr:A/G-specific adenine glycosylase [Candidatus Protochlamydia phocaeensis]
MTKCLETDKLKAWFLAEKRELPWREQADPYAVWISEVMLQQTQVAVVLPYFQRWMQRFPTIADLAAASIDEVIKVWEGLGYYSRARYLHEGAKYLVEHFNGQLPASEERLKTIKGLGPYTIGAILSFAFHQKKAAVDGNVLRVLARYFQLEDDIAKAATVKKLRLLAESLLPDEEPWIISEALIELGATVCQRKARCMECPLRSSCLSYRNGVVDRFPVKSKGAQTEYLYRAVAVIRCQDRYLVKRGKKGEIMSDLYEFPFFPTQKERLSSQQLREIIQQQWGLMVCEKHHFPSIMQGFTRYQARLDPVLFACSEEKPVADLEWVEQDVLKQRAFSSGHRRLFEQIQALDLPLPA